MPTFLDTFFKEFGKYFALALAASLFLFLLAQIPSDGAPGSILHQISRLTEVSFGGASLKFDEGVKNASRETYTKLSDEISALRAQVKKLEENSSSPQVASLNKRVPETSIAAETTATVSDKQVLSQINNITPTSKELIGAIWIGNKNQPLKIKYQNGNAIKDLTQLSEGALLTSKADLVVRSDYPSPVANGYYKTRTKLSVLKPDQQIESIGEVSEYTLPNGITQYWLKIRTKN